MNTYRVLYKIPNTFNHIFVRINQEGLISILMSPLNIWPNPVINSNDLIVKTKQKIIRFKIKFLSLLIFAYFTPFYFYFPLFIREIEVFHQIFRLLQLIKY